MAPRTMTTIAFSFLCAASCTPEREVQQRSELPAPQVLEAQCRDEVGPPRVEEVAEGLFLAIGYDLANTILLRTAEGNVVVDVSMSPARAETVRKALLEKAPGPTRAIVYTHSHIDHVGGASVWVEEGTEIWATEAFRDHLVKQYGVFQPTESRRGARQFGRHVTEEDLPCIALGPRLDFGAVAEAGIRFPTRTFSGATTLEIGGVTLELVEAHGETHDQLFVWIPKLRALLPGDNFYSAFPNLYTIRGTSPRPIDDWIGSIDEMRRRRPALLVPSHTRSRKGEAEIQEALRNYRDGIQWVRDETVRRANRGAGVDAIAEKVGLPPHLTADRDLAQLYGQVDWSARAIYSNELGWFDGRPEELYPLGAADAAREEVRLMGGIDRILEEAGKARTAGRHRWAVHLLAKAERSGLVREAKLERLHADLAAALRGLAGTVTNTNGRAYLLESAWELEHGYEMPAPIRIDDPFIAGIPLRTFFTIMSTRLVPGKALDVHETVEFHFPEAKQSFFVTVRRGVAELAEGEPLPGTPKPLAVVEVDPLTWRRIALDLESPARALAAGRLKVSGDWLGFLRFSGRFRRGV